MKIDTNIKAMAALSIAGVILMILGYSFIMSDLPFLGFVFNAIAFTFFGVSTSIYFFNEGKLK